jgi:transcriptional regulator with XRE-family HTH domain
MGIGQRYERGEIRALRESLGMNPDKFAETIRQSLSIRGLEVDDPVFQFSQKLSGMTIRRWEAGETTPSAHGLEAISRAFGVRIERFFADSD